MKSNYDKMSGESPSINYVDETEDVKDRGDISLSQKNNSKKNSRKKVFMIILLGVLLSVITIFVAIYLILSFSTQGNKPVQPAQSSATKVEQSTPDISGLVNDVMNQKKIQDAQKARDQEQQQAAREEEQRRVKAEENARRVLEQSNQSSRQPAQSASASAGDEEMTPAQRRLTGEALVEADEDDEGDNSLASNSIGSPSSRYADGSLNQSLRGDNYPVGRASVMKNSSMLLKRGTVIPCVLQNKVVSTYPGLQVCEITQDVFSADGRVVLIERGSQAYGEQRVALMKGQARLFVTWNDIDTPSGITINIDSLGVDNLGASGVEAFVDTHFFERFGSSIMLSFIDDGLEVLANRLQKAESSKAITLDNTQDGSKKLAEVALSDSIDIPPTGYVNHATLINIRVSRNVDFSNVYKLSSDR